MESYSLNVALFDFVPVLTTALALALLARGIAHRHKRLARVAWVAAVVVPLGGLCKASWKLIVATQQLHIDWLENLLFILLAPGFVALAFSLHHTRRAWRAGVAPDDAHYPLRRLLLWLIVPWAGALLAALLLPESRLWFFWLLGITTAANAALLVQAAMLASWSGLGWPVLACFFYNFLATLALSGLSRLSAGENAAWIQEGVNLSAQLALALGFWRLGRSMQQDN